MGRIVVETPAKLNLVLEVLGRREDGYHEIRSLLVAINLCDRLTLEDAPDGRIELRCSTPGIPVDERNLVHQAALRLSERLGGDHGCRIDLEKRIPAGSGLGGGSSDAAATLKALNELWQGGLSNKELSEIGGGIGSDVPFFFNLPCAIVSGRGEHVRPVRMRWKGWAALAMAGDFVSTREAYGRWAPGKSPDRRDWDELLNAGSAEALNRRLCNHLKGAVGAIAPRVRALLEEMAGLNPSGAGLSGAGSVGFALFDNRAEAEGLVERIRSNHLADEALVVEVPAPPFDIAS